MKDTIENMISDKVYDINCLVHRGWNLDEAIYNARLWSILGDDAWNEVIRRVSE